MMTVWRYLFAPVLYPIVSAPLLLIGFVAKPLQLILILGTWGMYSLHVVAGWVFVAVAGLYYAYTVLIPPPTYKTRQYYQWISTYGAGPAGGRVGQYVFTVGMLVAFVLGLIYLPSFNSVLRWFAALGLAYYLSAVAMGFVVTWTTPSLEAEIERIREESETEFE